MAGSFMTSLGGKILAIGAITVGLLLPLARMQSLVYERAGMRDEAAGRVAAAWGANQFVGPPILAIPVEMQMRQGDRLVSTTVKYHALSASAAVEAKMQTEQRQVGIYTVPVYVATVSVSGQFSPEVLAELDAESPVRTVIWKDARLLLPLSDSRGIREIRQARAGGRELKLEPGSYDSLAGVIAAIDVSGLRAGQPLDFSFDFELAGSGSLKVLPLAQKTTAHLRSAWPHPNFSSSAFLPARRSVSAQGFDAEWQVLELNRGFSQTWIGSEIGVEKITAMAFGVDLYQPVDTYQRNTRATKYGLLFIAITFMSVFLWEHASGLRLHVMQYLLVGLALCVFYLLLLALSEHLQFGQAYLVASAALVVLIGVYMAGALRRRAAGAMAGGALGTVYALLYLLILSEDYALLFGALLVFAVLATIMVVTRKLDWHALAHRSSGPDVAPPRPGLGASS